MTHASRPTNPSRAQRRVLAAGIATGTVAFLLPAAAHLASSPFSLLEWLPALVLLPLALVQVFFSWYLFSRVAHRIAPPAQSGVSVDVFVTACREPEHLVARALRAAVAMRYPHVTWLLDDGSDPHLEALARRLGAQYLTRSGRREYKAGNVNEALRRTRGEFVAIFDVDHVPAADFLERTLGHFRDSRMGFVQTMVTFSNRHESLVAEASAQTSYEYYNLLAVGKARCGAAGLMGSNAVLRRSALESIGGYHPGLAEDLETSLRLHAAGWRSSYVCEPLAPGLTPADLEAFFKQQAKWATGVFNAALQSFPGLAGRLSPLQRLAYIARFTSYLIGPVLFVHMAAVVAGLFWPAQRLELYLANLLPFLLISLTLRCYVMRRWATDPEARSGFCWKGMALVTSAWPVYVTSLLTAVLRVRTPFVATPKIATPGGNARLVIPQLTMVTLFAAGLMWRALQWSAGAVPFTMLWALVFILAHGVVLRLVLEDVLGVSAPLREHPGEAA